MTTNLGDFLQQHCHRVLWTVSIAFGLKPPFLTSSLRLLLISWTSGLGAVTSKVLTINRTHLATSCPAEVQDVLMDTANDYRDELARVTTQVAAGKPGNLSSAWADPW